MAETSSVQDDDQELEPATRRSTRGRRSPLRSGAMLFPELVWAHYEWQREVQPRSNGSTKPRHRPHVSTNGPAAEEQRRNGRRALEARYHRVLSDFQSSEGEIRNAYWCVTDASAVVLAEKNVSRLRRLGLRRPDLRLYRATDWVAADVPAIASLLHHCDALAIRVSQILPRVPKRIAMEWIYAEESFLLGYLERTEGRPSKKESELVAQEHAEELKLIERYYDRAASKAARIFYFTGMIIGVLFLAGVGAALAGILDLFGSLDLGSPATQNFFASFGAGTVGALVSVMARMRSDAGFSVDYEVGRGPLLWLGVFRPAVGAIFAAALFFALESGFVQLAPTEDGTFYFYAFVAFLAGFSERFAHVIFGNAELTIASALSGGAGGAAPPSDDRPAGDDTTSIPERTQTA